MNDLARHRLDDILAGAVGSGAAPGLVAIVATEGSLLYEGAFGVRDVRSSKPVGLDTIFRIASMTKLVTAISMLQLVEEGLVELDTPVGDVLPEFDELAVLEGFDGDRAVLRPAASRATLRQLLTHTSGLAYDIWNREISRFHAVSDVPRLQTGLRDAYRAPLVSDPGVRFNYGTSMDWVGLVVEKLSRMSLDRYWATHLFEPLGLSDTTPAPTIEQRERLTPVHAPAPDRGWVATNIDFAQHPEVYAGGHCLYSTARDYLAIQRLMLGGGTHAGRRYLECETVDAIFENQLGKLTVGTIETTDPVQSEDIPLGARKWGLGILLDPIDEAGGPAAGSGGWMGGFNTFYWVDRARGLTGSLYAQTIPFYRDDIVDVFHKFAHAAYAALDN
jgi:CubicO group peptidase (beta-lactamase class C family)